MQRRESSEHDQARRAQATENAPPRSRDTGHAVLENIERSEALPASVSATEAFEGVMGSLVQRLPAEQAALFVERHLPRGLSSLLERDAEEALEDGVEGDLADYVDEVAGKLELANEPARELIDVVIGSLRILMSAEEVDGIANELSPQLAKMWIEASHVPGAPSASGTP